MKNIYFLYFFVFIATALFSQKLENGVPSFKNYSPQTYGQESQNFSVLQDKNSLMYFGNSNGIMEFDNTNWRIIKVTGRPVMDINSKNEIFYGGYNQMGKLITANGILKLKNFYFYEDILPGQVNKVIAFDNEVFFSTSHQLLIYKNDTLELEQSNAQGINIFKINNQVLINLPSRGLYFWSNGKILPYENSELFQKIDIADIVAINDKELLIKPSKEDGFIKYRNGIIERFYTEVDAFIQTNIYSTAIVLANGNIIVGTLHGGLVCVNKNGDYLYSINRDNGLRDNQITDLYIDSFNKLWATTYNGITLIETQSKISFFDSSFGFNGAVLSVLRVYGSLYVGTVNGLYRYSDLNIYDKNRAFFDDKKRFEKVEGIRAMCWQLKEINGELYAITIEGIYKIKENKAQLLLSGSYNYLSEISQYPNKYLLGGSRGLLITNINKMGVDTIGYLKGLNYNIRTINEDYFGNIWMGTNEDGLYKTNFKNGLSKNAELIHYTEADGLPKDFDWVDVFNSYYGTVFSTNKGIYRFNYATDKFEVDTLMGMDFSKGNLYVYPVAEDISKNLWYSCVTEGHYERETGVMNFNGAKKKYSDFVSPFVLIREFAIETIYPEDDGIVWFGSSDALIKYNSKEKENEIVKFPCLIRKLTIHNDSIIYLANSGKNSDFLFKVKFKDKTIRFDFSALSYNTFGENEYQVMLEGFDDNWSAWSKETFKEYTSLTENKYTFKVRAKDIYGNISPEAVVYFEVEPPFYRTGYAIVIYVILFGALIYLILKLNELRHAKERFSLEKLVEDRTNELAYQKEQTEQLVKRLLPQNAADEIRETGKAKSQKYEMVTVLFADIQGFTKIAEYTPPEELIRYLNKIFISFDRIIAEYNIEKIKTIGDAYMCAGGMPNVDNTNPIEVVLAALEMQRELKRINEESALKLEIRIGIHTGPVVAGVVGDKKLEYDIWGDTVNIASRMESHGIINKVNVSEATFNVVKDFFVCQYRGKIEVKYKGELEMYFIHEIKKVLSENADRKTPNKDFFIKLQFIKLKFIQEEILDQLQRNLPANLYYHNLKHTINVLYMVETIAREEAVDEEEMLLLKCAALFHDAGFLVSYDNNEEIGAKMAAQTLQKFKFSVDQIETVKRLIMATKMPPKPKDLLEKIICDADLDYLGRPDFIPISQNLFRELFERGKINSIEQWNKMQYKFMLSHNYFTVTARKERDHGKQSVLTELKEMI
jgi:class 3 adenylate cyclase/ligand-binding sensor domain-containing protein